MENTNERILFENKNIKVETLSLEELSQTVIAHVDIQKSRTTPVAHFEFIQKIMEILTAAGRNPKLDHIYASNTGGTTAIRNIEEEKGLPKILCSWLLRKITGKIMIDKLGDEEMTSCIAFSYHDKGIDLAYGHNVHDCSNMSIFGSNVLHTYGAGKNVSYETMLEVFTEWCNKMDEMHKKDMLIIAAMKGKKIKGGGMLKFMGKLLSLAVGFNIGMKVVAPLNVTQCGEVTKGILSKDPNLFNEDNEITLWEFYNFMTFVMKGDKADITSLLTDIVALGNMMVEEYHLEK